MEAYIGTKIVLAEPMSKGAAFEGGLLRGPIMGSWHWHDLGYKVVYEDGYASWSPKDTFERAYRKVTQAEAELAARAYPAA